MTKTNKAKPTLRYDTTTATRREVKNPSNPKYANVATNQKQLTTIRFRNYRKHHSKTNTPNGNQYLQKPTCKCTMHNRHDNLLCTCYKKQ